MEELKFFRDGLDLKCVEPPRTLIRDGHTCEVFKTKDGDMWFVTLEGTHYCAHGESFHDAVIAAKEKQHPGAGKAEAVQRVLSSGQIGLTDFCLVTGACRAGATMWAKEQGISPNAALPVKDVLTKLDDTSSASWANTLREILEEQNGMD